VIGIIAILIGLLMPAFTKARAQANGVRCQSNLRQIGIYLQTYVNENKGWIFPVGPTDDPTFPLKVTTFGTQYPPHERWPMRVSHFVEHPPDKLPYDPTTYVWNPTQDDEKFSTHQFTSPLMFCPSDFEPAAAHSYMLNQHLADQRVRSGTHNLGGMTSVEVVVMGEKKTEVGDYYMEVGDYAAGKVEPFRHGLKLGSNYLKLDWHVDTLPPDEAKAGMDPWALKLPDASTQPTGG
jgi:type II secretory pathway pseudopilin PulG